MEGRDSSTQFQQLSTKSIQRKITHENLIKKKNSSIICFLNTSMWKLVILYIHMYLYIHNFDFSSNFDAFFSLNWYCPSRNKYDDHVLLNLQGHIVFMHSNCKGVYPCIKHGPFILWWSMHKRVHESSINHMIILDMVMTNQSPWPWY
jgi:hypothetical protein